MRLPRHGKITLEDGELVARRTDGAEMGRLYVFRGGLIFEGEVWFFQPNDPSKVRFLGMYDGEGRGYAGGPTFNLGRWQVIDGQLDVAWDEIAYWMGGSAEDARPGETRGQVSLYVKLLNAGEPMLAQVWTSAYSFALFGTHRLWTGVRNIVSSLSKFSTPELPEGTSSDDPHAPTPLPDDPPLITDEERAERVLDVEAARLEFPDQPLDENGVQSYLAGRKDLREFHDDEERRAGFCREPYHRPGRPY